MDTTDLRRGYVLETTGFVLLDSVERIEGLLLLT